jgi:GDP-L-fucose synthase
MAEISPLRGKRIVLSGGAGFLGSFVSQRLTQKGASLFIPRSAEYDLTQMSAVERLYRDAKPEIVIHLAARVGGIGANQRNPASYFYDNLMMGVQLLHLGYVYQIEKFVGVGTICAYPKFAPIPFQEDQIWEGYPEETNAPYGLAKKMMLVQSQAYGQQYGFNSTVLFPVNLYGPRDNFELESSHVIPAIIRKAVAAKERGERSIRLWGDGSPSREFLYVDDAAEGIVLATERYNSTDPVNLGNGREIRIVDLARMICDLCQFTGEISWDQNRPNGQPRRCLDVSRARERFGFVAQTSLERGLRQTVDWYLTHRDLADGRSAEKLHVP